MTIGQREAAGYFELESCACGAFGELVFRDDDGLQGVGFVIGQEAARARSWSPWRRWRERVTPSCERMSSG